MNPNHENGKQGLNFIDDTNKLRITSTVPRHRYTKTQRQCQQQEYQKRRLANHIQRCQRHRQWHRQVRTRYQQKQLHLHKEQTEPSAVKTSTDKELNDKLKELEEYDTEKLRQQQILEQQQVKQFEITIQLEKDMANISLTRQRRKRQLSSDQDHEK